MGISGVCGAANARAAGEVTDAISPEKTTSHREGALTRGRTGNEPDGLVTTRRDLDFGSLQPIVSSTCSAGDRRATAGWKAMNRSSGVRRPIHPSDERLPRSVGEAQIKPDVHKLVDAQPGHPIWSQVARLQVLAADVEISLKRRDAPESDRALGDDLAARSMGDAAPIYLAPRRAATSRGFLTGHWRCPGLLA